MYYAQYIKRLDEIERRQKARPRKSLYKDLDGNTHPASILQLLTYEADYLLHGTPSPIKSCNLDERAMEATPIIASLFELVYKSRKETKK